jgi:hypothetical protein
LCSYCHDPEGNVVVVRQPAEVLPAIATLEAAPTHPTAV